MRKLSIVTPVATSIVMVMVPRKFEPVTPSSLGLVVFSTTISLGVTAAESLIAPSMGASAPGSSKASVPKRKPPRTQMGMASSGTEPLGCSELPGTKAGKILSSPSQSFSCSLISMGFKVSKAVTASVLPS